MTSEIVAPATQLPESFYYILGVLVLTNLGTIVTIIGAAVKLIVKVAVLETKIEAMHRRQDAQEGKNSKDESEE